MCKLLSWLQFVPGTHLVFSAGKDHMVKCWDGDKFDHVMSLPVCVVTSVLVFNELRCALIGQGHQAEVWCMSISSDGGYMVSCVL